MAMMDVMEMSDLEIRERLKFTAAWWDLGIVDEPWVARAVRGFREGDDHSDEHYRYGSFVAFLRRTPVLTEQQCEALMDLGANDPDWLMGASIMLDVLRRRECPERLFEVASKHPRTMKYAAKLWAERRFDSVKHRGELRGLGVEGYYRKFGYRKSGRRRPDQSVYKEMKELFAIDYKAFREVRDRAGEQ